MRREHAEFVAFRITQHDPGLLALSDVGVCSAEPEQPRHFGISVVRPEVEV